MREMSWGEGGYPEGNELTGFGFIASWNWFAV